jgi:hypothetical protein
MGELWESYGRVMGELWESYGRAMGKLWRSYGDAGRILGNLVHPLISADSLPDGY